MSMLDFFTGGNSSRSEDALRRAEEAFGSIQTPTKEQLSLPELQQYVQAGLMTPAQAEAYLQKDNAFNTENVNQGGTAAMVQALNQLSDVSDAGPMGTPIEQAQVANTEQQMGRTLAGQRGSIEQEMAAKGTPAAMIQAALANQYAGQDASLAHQDAMQAQAQAYQTAVNALAEKGNLGATLQGQQNTQANTVAQAQNAMQQFNAANQQQASALNANLKQQANLYNTAAGQKTSDQNTQLKNSRTVYNAQTPQTVFEDQMAKARGQAGVNEDQAKNYTGMGQQNAGIWSGIIGGGSNMASDALTKTGPAAAAADPAALAMLAKGGIVSHDGCYHDGGICMDDGGMIPGKAQVPGDSLKNDKVPVMASPGEAVIPRTAVQQHLPEVLSLISGAKGGQNVPRETSAHPQDVATLLHALRAIRTGAA